MNSTSHTPLTCDYCGVPIRDPINHVAAACCRSLAPDLVRCYGDLLSEHDKLKAHNSTLAGTLKREIAQRNALLEFAQIVARSACLQQFNGDKCICFACEARNAIALAQGGGK